MNYLKSFMKTEDLPIRDKNLCGKLVSSFA